MHVLSVKTDRPTQLVDVTPDVQRFVSSAKITSGLCHLYVPHTTAGIMINEHADPDVATDVAGALDRLVPSNGPYLHGEGNSDAHIKAVLTGTSLTIFIEDGKLVLGRWQGIFFCEFDGPRDRHLHVKIVADSK
jgi:secondary thiamine-phosphate synthase enzyme